RRGPPARADQAGGAPPAPAGRPAGGRGPGPGRRPPRPGRRGRGGGGGSPEPGRPIRRALVSVFDKQGLDRLAGALGAAGVEVVSTGSTAAALEDHGPRGTPREAVTGLPASA